MKWVEARWKCEDVHAGGEGGDGKKNKRTESEIRTKVDGLAIANGYEYV
jgi:hypothetical protein